MYIIKHYVMIVCCFQIELMLMNIDILHLSLDQTIYIRL